MWQGADGRTVQEFGKLKEESPCRLPLSGCESVQTSAFSFAHFTRGTGAYSILNVTWLVFYTQQLQQ